MKLILWSTLSFLLIGTLAFVVACDREEEEAKEEVVLTIGTIPEFTTLDPNNLQSIESPYHKAVTDGLVKLSADTLEPTPKLATDWSFSPDARSLTLTIRKGVKFHNGRELTPDDVLQNLNRILDPETGLSIHGSFGTIERGEVVGDTLVIHFKEPTPAFMSRIPWWHIIAPESFETASNKPIGTGPYKIVEWRAGEELVVEKFDDYWDKGSSNVDRIVYKFFSDPETMVTAASAGQLDMIQYAQAKDTERLQDAGYVIAGTEGGPTLVVIDYLILWLNPSRVLTNPDLRSAIARSIDRETVVRDTLFGVSSETTLPVPKANPSWDAERDAEWQYDLEAAKQLVEKSGVQNPEFTVMTTFAFPELVQTAELLQADLGKIGVTMNIDTVDGNTHSDHGLSGDYEALFWFASAGIVDPVDFEDNSGYRISTGILWGGPDQHPEDYRTTFKKASSTIDPQERVAAFKEVWKTLRKHTWAIPIAWRPVIFGHNGSELTGVEYDAYIRLIFRDLVKSQ